jgi:Tat protein translocase TatB subunit
MFGTLGGPELFLIFVVALIVFGPRKLPEIGKSLGRMMSEFRRASNDFRSTIESEVESEKIRESMRIEAPKVTPAKGKAPSAGDEIGDSSPAKPEGDSSPTGPDASPEGPEPALATDDAATPSASEPPAGGPAGSPPMADAPPETVSRRPPAPAGEQK